MAFPHFSESWRHGSLDHDTIDLISLHNGDPGSSGTGNEITGGGYARKAATFAAASAGARALSANVEFDGPADASVTHVAFWKAGAPDVYQCAQAAPAETTFSGAGKLILSAGDTQVTFPQA